MTLIRLPVVRDGAEKKQETRRKLNANGRDALIREMVLQRGLSKGARNLPRETSDQHKYYNIAYVYLIDISDRLLSNLVKKCLYDVQLDEGYC